MVYMRIPTSSQPPELIVIEDGKEIRIRLTKHEVENLALESVTALTRYTDLWA